MRRSTLAWLMCLSLACSSGLLTGEETKPSSDAGGRSSFAVTDDLAAIPEFLRVPLPHDVPPQTCVEFFRTIGERTGLTIDVNPLELEDLKADLALTPTIPKGTPLFRVLDLGCDATPRKSRLAWFPSDSGVVVTGAAVASETKRLRFLPVDDLIQAGCHPLDLVEAIVKTVSGARDGSRDETGVDHQGRMLIVRQDFQSHREIATLLAALRSPAELVWCGRSEQDRKIWQQLDRERIQFPGGQLTLQDFAGEIERITGTSIEFDRQGSMDDPSKFVDPVPSIEGTLRQVLQRVLGPEPFSLDVRGRKVQLTRAAKAYFPAVYNLGPAIRIWHTPYRLEEVLTAMTAGPWDSAERGTGTVSVIWERGQIVVWQTAAVHAEIEIFLRESAQATPQVDPDRVETRTYQFRDETAEDLLTTIPTVIEPDSWRTEKQPERTGFLTRVRYPDSPSKAAAAGVNTSLLIVRNSVRVLEQVELLLFKLGWDADPRRRPGILPFAPPHPK